MTIAVRCPEIGLVGMGLNVHKFTLIRNLTNFTLGAKCQYSKYRTVEYSLLVREIKLF